ncbi:hypothetical protein ADK59_14750 [Streptomyces sp. XY332]|nr:hypothetical protein VR46_33755 [Streptomyces sp. NRRL S-444]KOY57210.1 hypothetical protein ADK59_14750 [Streptomyces sp. XY332]
MHLPGQQKRKRSRERAHRRAAAVPGHWEPLFSTQVHAELKEYVRRLHAERTVEPECLRIDQFCGRNTHPSTYQVSIFVRDESA